MEYKTVDLGEKIVIGLAIKTTNANNQAMQDIQSVNVRFYAENMMSKIPHRKNDDILAVYTDYEGDYTKPYTYLLGCEVTDASDVPEGLTLKSISTSKYALIEAKGKFPESVVHAWLRIWDSDLKRKYTADFEVYGKQFRKEPPEVGVYIAITE